MVKVKRAKLSNIGRFVGDHEIDLSSKSNFIQVDSENNNTGGSSGGGKSTIFSAIEYVLGINDAPSTVLQSRLTKAPMCVELLLEKDGKEYTIKRHKSEGLSISGPDLEVSGNSKVAEDELNKILGMPLNLLRPMIHKKQGERGFFLSKTPKQSHEFLMECLGMNSIDDKIAKLEKNMSDRQKLLAEKESDVRASEAALEATRSALQSLVVPKTDVDEDSLARVFERLVFLKQERGKLVSMLEEKLSLIKKPPSLMYTEDPKVLQSLTFKENEITHLSEEIRSLDNNIQVLKTNIAVNENHIKISEQAMLKLPTLEQDLSVLKQKITEALRKTCPTCKQDMSNESVSNSVVSDLVIEAKKKKEELDFVATMSEKLPDILLSIKEDKKKLEDCLSKKTEFQLKMAYIKNQIQTINDSRSKAYSDFVVNVEMLNKVYENDRDSVSKEYLEKIESVDNQIEAYNQVYHRGQASLKSYQDAIKTYETQKDSLESKIKTLKEKFESSHVKLAETSFELKLSQASIKLLKSYSNQLFRESLAIVADTATKILSRIPNMSTATITFDSFKETKSGTIKEEVVPILSIDDEIDVPVKSMSGGERASVDLAVDLAVIDMIESQTGNGIDIFILDEPFDGLDAVCRENCLEVLKNHASNRKILIVDHSTETKQMVQDKIIVYRDGQHSKIGDTL